MSGAEFVEIDGGDTVWRFDRDFMTSNWHCIFGDGCRGILPEPSEELQQGCCSYGAHLGDGADGRTEALNVSAYASTLTPRQWQLHGVSPTGIFSDDRRNKTRVVDGACVFLNRPGFDGELGCALHIGAVDAGESPTEWKPSVCWQLPIRVDWEPLDDGRETATVRRWQRADWGEIGETMDWCCTERSEGGEAFTGSRRVVDSLAEEIAAVVGDAVAVELSRRLV
ncbi:MAG: hypothetical protein ABIP17_00060 [Ilumatobacteraceae bacterium]